jgi:serine palmitoyltransferase
MTALDDERQFEAPPRYTVWFAHLVYIVINLMGNLREFLVRLGLICNLVRHDKRKQMRDFPSLYSKIEQFYFTYVYLRIRYCTEFPVLGLPSVELTLQKRSRDDKWNYMYENESYKAINMGSYNYLGFAESEGPCADRTEEIIQKAGLGVASSRQEIGTTQLHIELEHLVAEFLGVEDALVFPQGFATNALNIPVLLDENTCVISDQQNHASLILGCRLGAPTTYIFKHNNMLSLESQLKKAVSKGSPKTNKPFSKIVIVVEGVYSMEGTIINLPAIIALKKKYNAYLYLDEAHSIGAVGPNGRGVVDYYGVDPRDIDILMGTFTKSFGSAGGYIAGEKRLIDYLRVNSHSFAYGGSMAAPVCTQILTSMRQIMSPMGKERIQRLAWNTRYFRAGMHKLGLIVMGSDDSPVVPILVLTPSHLSAFSRMAHDKGLAAAVVGFPATKLTEARVRFCVSASHTKDMLDKAIEIVDEIADVMHIRYSRRATPDWCWQFSHNDIKHVRIHDRKQNIKG